MKYAKNVMPLDIEAARLSPETIGEVFDLCVRYGIAFRWDASDATDLPVHLELPGNPDWFNLDGSFLVIGDGIPKVLDAETFAETYRPADA